VLLMRKIKDWCVRVGSWKNIRYAKLIIGAAIICINIILHIIVRYNADFQNASRDQTNLAN
jgi:hypothetical protein